MYRKNSVSCVDNGNNNLADIKCTYIKYIGTIYIYDFSCSKIQIV